MRWLIALGLTFITLGGCSLEEALENAPCESDDDCLGEQTCVKTEHQLATQSVGSCRSSGECAAGEQVGCIADGDGCGFTSSVTAVMGPSGTAYCCPNLGSAQIIVIEAADQSSAWCITADSPVLCTTDTDCPSGLPCERTLEQQQEDAQELEPADQAQEDGWCLPDGCIGGAQEGCSIGSEQSCGSGLTETCAGSRCYCCEIPVSDGYTARVYEETDLGESAACVACPPCPSGETVCTMLTDQSCVLTEGACGCAPSA